MGNYRFTKKKIKEHVDSDFKVANKLIMLSNKTYTWHSPIWIRLWYKQQPW